MGDEKRHLESDKKSRTLQKQPIQVGILTVSDSCSRNAAVDKSGKKLANLLASKELLDCEVVARKCVPDEMNKIQEVLKKWADGGKIDLILTTGGTGFTARDITPEATKLVIDREAPGISTAIMCRSLKITPMAMLSRAISGIRKRTLIINLPGSAKGSQECFQQVYMVISHAVDQLREEKELVALSHLEIQGSEGNLGVYDAVDIPEKHTFIRDLEILSKTHGNEYFLPQISIGPMSLDLYLLYKTVKQHGGFSNVNKDNCWKDISKRVGMEASLVEVVKVAYAAHLLPYEQEMDLLIKLEEEQKRIFISGYNEGIGMQVKSRKSCVEVTKVAHRDRQSTYPMISVKEAQDIVLNCTHILSTKVISYKESLGYVLSEDIFAKDDLPPFPASIKDGYAVLASDGVGLRKVIGDNIAGGKVDQFVLVQGTCVRISTGAAVPSSADAVIQVEDTILIEQSKDGRVELVIEVLKAAKVGQDIRPVGSDIKSGQHLLSKGMSLGSAELGVLAAAGIINVPVFTKPVVAVLSTGNELLKPEEPLRPGCVRDSNKTSLMNLLQEQEFTPIDIGVAKDSPDEVLQKLEESFNIADVLISTGGVSMGEKDLLKQVLEVDFKATIHFARVFMKPGKPTTFATLTYNGKKKIVFGLPGNPVSAMVTSHLYVIPCLREMMGCLKIFPTAISAKLSFDVKLDPRPEYHRASLSFEPGDSIPYAYSTGYQISSRLISMSSANALLILPPYSESVPVLKKGEIVTALVINKL